MNRDSRTLDAISQEELEILKTKSVCVVGAGGLGGYAIEMLARIGVGNIKVVDNDVFDETDLNRQLLATEHNLGVKKVIESKERVSIINSKVKLDVIDEKLAEGNAIEILKHVDIVVDCVDNLRTRYVLQSACKELDIPMIHGAVGAWQGQVSTVFPGDRTISRIYGNEYTQEIAPIGTASFLPGTVASYQVAECVKVILDKGEVLQNKVMYIDLLNNQSFMVDLDSESEDI